MIHLNKTNILLRLHDTRKRHSECGPGVKDYQKFPKVCVVNLTFDNS